MKIFFRFNLILLELKLLDFCYPYFQATLIHVFKGLKNKDRKFFENFDEEKKTLILILKNKYTENKDNQPLSVLEELSFLEKLISTLFCIYPKRMVQMLFLKVIQKMLKMLDDFQNDYQTNIT